MIRYIVTLIVQTLVLVLVLILILILILLLAVVPLSCPAQVNENMGCDDAVMKKRAELAARFIDQFIGAQVG